MESDEGGAVGEKPSENTPTEEDPTTSRSGSPSESPSGPGELRGDEEKYFGEQDEAEQGDKDQQQG